MISPLIYFKWVVINSNVININTFPLDAVIEVGESIPSCQLKACSLGPVNQYKL